MISEADILFLQLNEESDDVKERMRRTVFGRRNILRSLATGDIGDIRKRFPRLFDCDGMVIKLFSKIQLHNEISV